MPTPISKLNLPIFITRTRTVFEKPIQQGLGVHDPVEDEMEEKITRSKRKIPIQKLLQILQGQ